MRKTLFALIALAGLTVAGAAPASAAVFRGDAMGVQTVQYYGGYGPRAAEWREREWRHREWERHRRWEQERRWHEGYGRW